MDRPEVTERPAARTTQWSIVAVDGDDHLVVILLGGHDYLPPGHWVITSPVVAIDETRTVAITASVGRVYVLEEPLAGPLPEEVRDLIDKAARIWRAKAKLKAERARRAADRGAAEPAGTEDGDPDAPVSRRAAPRRGGAP